MNDLKLMVTLWPSFPHFGRFACDERLIGIRMNSAMISNPELEAELLRLPSFAPKVPLYFDIKARQPRVVAVHRNHVSLHITVNHPISVALPTVVLFKAGADWAVLREITEEGRRLIFDGGPQYTVDPGESFHIRDASFNLDYTGFTESELQKIEQVRTFGFDKYFLSYVECQRDVDMFLDLVGTDVEVYLKIETKRGLQYVAEEFQKRPNLRLVAARGDLYVEIDRPHDILSATKLIIEKDPEACVASRLLLSVIPEPVPSCADFSELAWLYDIGYRTMMLCDELCLKEELLATAMNVFESFRGVYTRAQPFSVAN